MKRTQMFLLIMGCLVPMVGNAQNYFGQNKNELTALHAAYAGGDFKKAATQMKAALMAYPDDPIVKENVLSVLKAVYALGVDLPVDWQIPKEFHRMKAVVQRSERDEVKYKLDISGEAPDLTLIDQIQLTQFPTTVVLDKRAGIGTWEVEPERNGNRPYFSLKTAGQKQPIATGLYLLKLELTNGKQTEGWFIIDSDMNPTTAPKLTKPYDGEAFSTGTPMFQWENYHSPQYQPSDRRSLWSAVYEVVQDDWISKWEDWTESPSRNQTVLGATAEFPQFKPLTPGRYVLTLIFQERRRFGDLSLSRESSVTRPFTISR